jgi:acyl carrier protein
MDNAVRDSILEIISLVTEKDPAEIAPDAHLVNDLGADSMMALEIMAAIERKFKVIIPEDKLREMTTLNKIVNITQDAAYVKQR